MDDNKIECDICMTTFQRKNKLKEHLKKKHDLTKAEIEAKTKDIKELKEKCKFCDDILTLPNMNAHVRAKHPNMGSQNVSIAGPSNLNASFASNVKACKRSFSLCPLELAEKS